MFVAMQRPRRGFGSRSGGKGDAIRRRNRSFLHRAHERARDDEQAGAGTAGAGEPSARLAPPAESRADVRADVGAASPVSALGSWVSLMEVEPSWLLVQWEIGAGAWEGAARRLESSSPRLVLRLHDLAARTEGAGEATGALQVSLDGLQGGRFLNLELPLKLLRGELGILGAEGRFAVLARSNTVQPPSGSEPNLSEDRMRAVRGSPPPRWSRRAGPFSGPSSGPFSGPAPGPVSAPSSLIGRSEIASCPLPAAEAVVDLPSDAAPYKPPYFPPAPVPNGYVLPDHERSLYGEDGPGLSRGRSGAASSGGEPAGAGDPFAYYADAITPGGIVPAASGVLGGPWKGATDSFSSAEGAAFSEAGAEDLALELNADVVIYGRTRPGTQVFLSGANIQVRSDGTFEARFALPPGLSGSPRNPPSGRSGPPSVRSGPAGAIRPAGEV